MDTTSTEFIRLYSERAVEKLGTTPDSRMGMRMGLSQLDSMTRGLHNGKLYVAAGRPGDGKTSFATTITANIMLLRDFPVLFVSTELTEVEVVLQIAEAYAGGIPVYPNRRKSTDNEIEILRACLSELGTQEKHGLLNIVHEKSIGLDDIKGWIELIKPEDDRHFLVIIDQASRMRRNDERGRRSYAIATEEMLNSLEALAHDSKAAILLMTQLNRQTEFQQVPTLANLKHSGAFEEYAAMVMLLDKAKGNGQTKPGSSFKHHDGTIHVAKNRQGTVGPIECNFHGECHRWTEKTERTEKW